jgi:hypothetical protein
VTPRRYLIRIFDGSFEDWSKDAPNFETLAKKAFKPSDAEQSVFEVANDRDECLAVAANALTNPKQRPDAKSIVRIETSDLNLLGIGVDYSEPGTTGVPKWDFRHRNIVAGGDDRDSLNKLIQLLVHRYQQGFDRLRRVPKVAVCEALKAICLCSSGHCPEHAKLIAQWCQKAENGPPTFFIHEIETEMDLIQLDDEVVAPLAHNLSTGDQIRDWYSALRQLRRHYAETYIPALKKRVGLR